MTHLIERHGVKIQIVTIVTVLMFTVGSAYRVGAMKAEANARLCTLESALDEVKGRTTECEKKSNTAEVELAKINTKLANIETTQQEIKTILQRQKK